MKIIVSGLLILCALIYIKCKQDIEQDETIQLEDIQRLNNPTISNNNNNNDDDKQDIEQDETIQLEDIQPLNNPTISNNNDNNNDDKQDIEQDETIQLEDIQRLNNPTISNNNDNNNNDNDDDNNDKNDDDNNDDNDDDNDEDNDEKIIDKIMEDSKKTSSRRRRRRTRRRSRSRSSRTFKSSCLKDANKYRLLHPGTPKLTWSRGLAAAAKRWANHMLSIKNMYHDMNRGKNVGENLWTENASGTGRYAPKLLSDVEYCKKANTYWYNEIKDYSYITHKSRNGKATGHFTQMVWKESERVGYGVAKSLYNNRMDVYVAARYSPPGNYNNQYESNVSPKKEKDGEVENFTWDVL